VILTFFSDEAGPAVKKDQDQSHETIAHGRGEYDGWPRSEVRVGNKKEKRQGLCSYYDLNEVIVPLHVPKDGKIKETETEKEKPRLPDKEKILYFY
jgi:hypothetical protein